MVSHCPECGLRLDNRQCPCCGKIWKKALISLFAVLLFAANASAAIPELCGNGIDDGDSSGTAGACPAGYTDAIYGTGCDLKCPGNDQDNDGYTTSQDCDDNNRVVIPGEYYPCDAGGGANSGYRLCNVGGSYGSCTSNATPLCESTGSGTCKYIDCGSGNNSNPGTYESPYLTFGKVSGGSPGSPPASPYTLQAGDVVYLKGTTDCSTTYSNGSVNEHAYFTTDGTLANPITIKRYPGATAKIIVESGERAFEYLGAEYRHQEDLEIAGSGTGQNGVLYISGSSNYASGSRLIFSDLAGNGDNNFSCWSTNGSTNTTLSHSILKDCYGSTGNQQNISAVKFINDDIGGDHTVARSVIYYTRATNSSCAITDKCGDAIRFKHGSTEVGAGINEVAHNYLIQPRIGLNSDTAGIFAHHNLIVQPAGTSTTAQNRGFFFDGLDADSNGNGNSIIEYNTVIDGQLFGHRPKFGVNEDVIVRYNIASDDSSSYNVDNGFYAIAAYGNDSQELEFRTEPILVSNFNCFYNATTSLRFNYFQAPSGSGGYGPAGDSGGQYTFAQWQTAGYDANSYAEDPQFDSYNRAIAANCDDKGWLMPESAAVYGGGSARLFRSRGKAL